MTEPPGARLRVALTGLTVAEYFRDVEGADTLSVHRQHFPLHPGWLRSVGSAGPHAQRRGLPAKSRDGDGRIAGADYFDEERFGYFGAGDLRSCRRLDRSRASNHLCSLGCDHCAFPRLTEIGIYPAVDPLASTSRILDPRIVGQEHYDVAQGVKKTLQSYKDLQDIIAILGIDELSEDQKITVARARKFKNSFRSRSTWPSNLPAHRAAT
jgi:F-type H+/Na+-transporting ATPase subunit beta